MSRTGDRGGARVAIGFIVLAIRFACELAALAALGWWGARASGIVLAIALPVAAATLWGAVVAPRARHRLRDPLRFAAECIVWASAVLALVDGGQAVLAAGFGVVAIGIAIASRWYEPDAVATRAPPADGPK